MVDQLSIPGVTILKLTGSNTFAVKKLLLHDDLAGDYLIYNPISYADPRENWLRDVELFSEEFRADYFSMLMDELNIRSNPVMRKTVRMYAAFFSNKERTAKLRRIGREYETPLQLHTDIMAVLAGLNGGSAQDVMIAVLSGGLDEEQNVALNAIKKFGNLDAFWQLVRKYTGYLHEDGQRLTLFAAHVLLTALAQAMNPSALKGLERFISESGEAYCYSLVHEWRSREDASALWELCRTVEQELQLPARFAKLETEALLAGDIFPAIHEAVLSRFLEEISERIVKPELFLQTVENRRTSGWYEQFRYYYDCLYAIARMQEFYQENAAGFHMTEPEKIWKFYADTAYKMDGWYREFYYAFGLALRDGNPVLEDRLKHTADYVETLYQNWYLKELNGCWANAIADGLSSLGYVPGIDRQRDFFAHYGKPAAAKNSRVFVIISDGLRYEVASELCGLLIRTTKGTAKLESMQSVFPSITKFGMAALLPGNRLSVNVNMEVFVDEMPTCSTAEREKVLCAGNPRSVAVQYEDVLGMRRAERRELIKGTEIVYIYHNVIDAIGDKTSTEKKVFEACADAVEELANLLRIIVNDMQGTDILITADHGFLYTYSPLTQGEKVSKDLLCGEIYETGRRYVLAAPDASAEYLLPVQMSQQIGGIPVQGFTPRDTSRIRMAGGGENYVHGGVSLQEMAVPVVCFKNLRSTSKQYVEVTNAVLKLLSESRKVTNLLFSLDFFQQQPVGDKVQSWTYTIYMADDQGAVVSDRQTVIADRTSVNASERVFRVRFSLKAGAYSSGVPYRLVIENGMDIPEEITFHIDIAFADDFGFDL